MADQVRIGVLGAAKITKDALIRPSKDVAGVAVVAVAARHPERASAHARKFGIPRVHASYEDLLADDCIDAVYIPLPAALHGHWTMAALESGKHVLVEKPFAANALEAKRVADTANRLKLVVMEAHHTSYHPLMDRLRAILDSGALGSVNAAEASFRVPIPPGGDIRWNAALGGGSLMDVGCYPLRLLLDLFGSEPEVCSAIAWTRGDIDRSMRATLSFDGTIRAKVDCSIWSGRIFSALLLVHCDRGRLKVTMPFHPHEGARISLDGPNVRIRERCSGRSSYSHQLEAFHEAVTLGTPIRTGGEAAVTTMRLIDSIYLAAGMRPRQPLLSNFADAP
ncbi:Gfo/Idh/MocA family protein [Arthrobacter sp. HS15c]|uniref:Gfo/Idh/MocA family protein n=1 Tax=Arthrobacter sp. HS15c TaxID=3230279 RepID=UPI003467C3E1